MGRLQYRVPGLGPAIRNVARRIAAQEGIIQRGIGKGLAFRANVPIAGYLLGTTEPEQQQVLAEYLKAGDVVYDVGANVGFYTLLAAYLVGDTGFVYAFEPYPESAAAARYNMEINAFDHVEVIEKAMADRPGSEWFDMETDPVTFKLAKNVGQKGKEVPVISVDTFLEQEPARAPDFIKIDVEGAEERVLIGMRDTLRDHQPVVLCEVHYAVFGFEQFVKREIGHLGYRIRTLDGGPIPSGDARFQVLLLPPERQPTGSPA